ncbi:hypothetical protein [Pseudomonas ovata]|uniref:hypothetical protein n=1 Tax=Pseudomonas ovata TaxID=1839709 RepID=UPI0012601C29|nr:hypothetical protein [Pseudomonas ovata]
MVKALSVNEELVSAECGVKEFMQTPAPFFAFAGNRQAVKKYQGGRHKACQHQSKVFLKGEAVWLYEARVKHNHEDGVGEHDLIAYFGMASSRPS